MQDSKNRIQKNSTKEIRFAVLFGTKQDVFIIENFPPNTIKIKIKIKILTFKKSFYNVIVKLQQRRFFEFLIREFFVETYFSLFCNGKSRIFLSNINSYNSEYRKRY